jgi:hypothetical protein
VAPVEHTCAVAVGMAQHIGLAGGPWGSPNRRWACTLQVGQARLNLFNYSKDFQISNQFNHAKYEKGTFGTPKIFKLCMLEDKFERKNFPFGKKFKFQMDLELKIQEINLI